MLPPEFRPLFEPVDAGAPCGPDLSYDPQMLRLEQAIEGCSGGSTGTRGQPDWPLVAEIAMGLLRRSKDMRVAVTWWRAALRRGDFESRCRGFASGLGLIAELCSTYWEHFHPLPDRDDYDETQRMNAFLPLTDGYVVPELMALAGISGDPLDYRNEQSPLIIGQRISDSFDEAAHGAGAARAALDSSLEAAEGIDNALRSHLFGSSGEWLTLRRCLAAALGRQQEPKDDRRSEPVVRVAVGAPDAPAWVKAFPPEIQLLAEPIDDDEPCGPDLTYDPRMIELELALAGRPEGVLDAAQPPAWSRAGELAEALLHETKDLRVAIALWRVALRVGRFESRLTGFAGGLCLIAQLCWAHWEHVHPRPDEGDLTERMNALGPLTDNLILPELEALAGVSDGPFVGNYDEVAQAISRAVAQEVHRSSTEAPARKLTAALSNALGAVDAIADVLEAGGFDGGVSRLRRFVAATLSQSDLAAEELPRAALADTVDSGARPLATADPQTRCDAKELLDRMLAFLERPLQG